jgi:hypothetical protein
LCPPTTPSFFVKNEDNSFELQDCGGEGEFEGINEKYNSIFEKVNEYIADDIYPKIKF